MVDIFNLNFKKHKYLRQFSKDYRNLLERIYRAEIAGERDTDRSAAQYMEDYATDFLELEPNQKRIPKELKEISTSIRKGKKSYEVYKDLVPDEMIIFLQTSELKGVKASMIFERYAPIKEMGDKMLRGIRKKLTVPLIMLAIFFFIVTDIMGTFKEIQDDGDIPFDELSMFFLDYSTPIMIIYALIFIVLLIFIPQKMPMLKKIFGDINGMLALASMNIMHEIAYDAGSMILPIKNQFKIKRSHPRKDIYGLTDILFKEGFITKDQASELRRTRHIQEGIEKALEQKKEIVEGNDDMVQDAVKEISVIMLAGPLLMVIYVLGNLMSSASDLLGTPVGP